MRDFMDVLVKDGILADGAIGTEIYQKGVFVNKCFDELNLTNPNLVKQIHKEYLKAGSKLFKTNTFTANRAALTAYGLEDQTKEINLAGVRLAKEVAGKKAYVAGSLGPVSSSTSRRDIKEEWGAIFREQIEALVEGGADVILLETFTNLDEIEIAIKVAKEVSNVPVIAQVSIKRIGENEFAGFEPEEAAGLMVEAGADVIGVNCADGPQGVYEVVQRIMKVTDKPVSAMPNAGMPKMVQGRMLYLATPEYMAEYARRYAQLGVALIGGCCGTTPAHIKEMKNYLKALRPSIKAETKEPPHLIKEKKKVQVVPLAERSQFGKALTEKFCISVEIDPPLGIDCTKAIEGAKYLKSIGVDVINIADGPRAVPRMSPIALGSIIKEKVGIEPVVHYCCRDRNVLGMQMDLLGAAALDLNNILIITGDPPKMGHYPDATAVFDMDSVGLIKFAANLNHGLDFANRPMKEATSLVIGCGCNPGSIDLDLEVERLFKKVEVGAEFIFSQPVYDLEMLSNFLDKIKGIGVPFLVGILPLTSLKNAEFLHNEVPGMQIPDHIMEKIRAESTKEGQRSVGIEVAREMFAFAKKSDNIQGAYIFPPLGKYELVGEIIR